MHTVFRRPEASASHKGENQRVSQLSKISLYAQTSPVCKVETKSSKKIRPSETVLPVSWTISNQAFKSYGASSLGVSKKRAHALSEATISADCVPFASFHSHKPLISGNPCCSRAWLIGCEWRNIWISVCTANQDTASLPCAWPSISGCPHTSKTHSAPQSSIVGILSSHMLSQSGSNCQSLSW